MEPCKHLKTKRGKDVQLRYGSHRSEVCRNCGSFRERAHSADGRVLTDWRPASEYEEATTEEDLD